MLNGSIAANIQFNRCQRQNFCFGKRIQFGAFCFTAARSNYAIAALRDGSFSLSERPLSRQNGAPICGKDFKTGQTLVKTVIAPMLKARFGDADADA